MKFAVHLAVEGDEDAVRRWFAASLAGDHELPFEVTYVRVRRARAVIMRERPEALDPRLGVELQMFDQEEMIKDG